MRISGMKKRDGHTNEYRSYVAGIALAVMIMLCFVAVANAIVDPYFHFHKPFTKYRLSEERYINDGIARNFDYDAVIIGNSLSQNFKTGRFDSLFGVKSVKLPYSGAGIKELWDALGRMLGRRSLDEDAIRYVASEGVDPGREYGYEEGYGRDVKTVIFVMDTEDALRNFKWHRYNDYPEYLYDENIWNDLNYLLNKEVLYRGTIYNLGLTLKGSESTSFDDYSSWDRESGPKEACEGLERIVPYEGSIRMFDDVDSERVYYNIECNINPVIDANPETQFIFVIPPKSIAKWAEFYMNGEIDYRADGMAFVTSLLLEKDNVEVYDFSDDHAVVTDLNYYCDEIHYNSEINDKMLECIANGEHRLFKEDCREYYEEIKNYYNDFNYEILNEYIEQ